MRIHLEEEKVTAKNSLPVPLSEFLDSDMLADVYADIGKTYRLNLRQIAVIIDLVVVTFSGLEPETDFDTNIRFVLPELSEDSIHSLVSSINEKVFVEAKRRLLESKRPADA